ncbi:MAG: SPFH domain-containing protein, partial [bacterium]|nr:SPFH domain-containing protein [bacterium]
MHTEKTLKVASGLFFLPFLLLLLGGSIWLFVNAITSHVIWMLITALSAMVVSIFLLAGLFVVNPNEAAVVLLFGDYRGTVKQNGFC